LRPTLGVLVFCLLLFSFHVQSAAQDQPPSADAQKKIDDNLIRKSAADADLAEANVKQAQIANDKAAEELATAKRADQLKNLPNPTLTGLPDGTISVMDQGKLVESELLAYRASGEIATLIGLEVKGLEVKKPTACNGKIGFFRDGDLAGVGNIRVFNAQTSLIKLDFEKTLDLAEKLRSVEYESLRKPDYITEAASSAAALVEAATKTAAEIVSLLQSKSQLFGIQVTLKQEAVEAQIARSLSAQGISTFNPHIFQSGVLDVGEPEFVKTFQNADESLQAQQKIIALDEHLAMLISQASKEHDEAAKKNVLARIKDHGAKVKAMQTALQALIDNYAKLSVALYLGGSDKPTVAAADSPLLALMQAELMLATYKKCDCLLTVSPVSMGGSVLTRAAWQSKAHGRW
jgi:hypothetical protein